MESRNQSKIFRLTQILDLKCIPNIKDCFLLWICKILSNLLEIAGSEIKNRNIIMWRSRTFLLDPTIKVLSIFQRLAVDRREGLQIKVHTNVWVDQSLGRARTRARIKFKDYFSAGFRGNSQFSERHLTNIPEWFNVGIGAFFQFAARPTRLLEFLTRSPPDKRPANSALPGLISFSHLRLLESIRPWNDHLRPAKDAHFKRQIKTEI